LRDDDVLVEAHAASINPLDAKSGSSTRIGTFAELISIKQDEVAIKPIGLTPILRYRLPLILGNDLAGVVVRVGSGVRRFKPGDQWSGRA
jgi:NADPH:quinone reductase-like Zn-dependent oxidoreductase